MNTSVLMVTGLVPGAAMIVLALGPYEGFFNHTKVFSSFAIGIVAGAFMGMFHGMLDQWALSNIVTTVVVFVFLFAVVQTMMLVVLLNRKGLRQKHDAVFSGLSLGAGAGSFMSIYYAYRILAGISISAIEITEVMAVSSSYTIVFTGAGIFAGMFAHHQSREHIKTAVGIFAVHALSISPYMLVWVHSAVRAVMLFVSIAVALFFFFYAYNVLHDNIPSELEREMRRESRRDRR